MVVPKRRVSRSRKGMRRSHDFLKVQMVVECKNCGHSIKPHRVCRNCGYYKNVNYKI